MLTMQAAYIHPTADVEEGVNIGPETRVWHQTHIRRNAQLGTGCNLGKNVFVDEDVTIGNGVKIQNNVSVYRGVSIEDDVFVGPSAVFTNDLRPRAANPSWTITPTRIRHGASIGANATIVCGIEIGPYAMIAAGAVVTRTVAAHQLVMGNPARPAGWVCACGELLSRAPEQPEEIRCAACLATQVDELHAV
ncbi:MAG: N-acetyltransferase [Corynebacteriales bacterium]|nr:N-acetyltransferase [Mycobacteriales bacterium]